MVRSISRMALLGTLLLSAAAVGGCQRESTWNLAPVEGTLLKDGHPLRGIEVVFLPDADTQGPRSRGITDETGHYRLRSDHGDDGAVVGSHRVCLHDTYHVLPPFANRPKEAANPKTVQKAWKELVKTTSASSQVPPRYGRFQETPLRVEVQLREQVINLEVK